MKKSQGNNEDCLNSSAFSCSGWKTTKCCWKALVFLLFLPLGKAGKLIFHYKTWIVPVPTKEKFATRPWETAQLWALPGPSRGAHCGAAKGTAALFWQSSTAAVKQITSRHLTILETVVSTEFCLNQINLLMGMVIHWERNEGKKLPQKCTVSHTTYTWVRMHKHTHKHTCNAMLGRESLKVWKSGVSLCVNREVWLMSNFAVGTAYPT